MNSEIFYHTNTLWLWTTNKAPASWHFITIDGEVGDAIKVTSIMRQLETGRRKGWGSIKVNATIGDTSWATSIFPCARRYLHLTRRSASVQANPLPILLIARWPIGCGVRIPVFLSINQP
jgi:hypothetical protein